MVVIRLRREQEDRPRLSADIDAIDDLRGLGINEHDLPGRRIGDRDPVARSGLSQIEGNRRSFGSDIDNADLRRLGVSNQQAVAMVVIGRRRSGHDQGCGETRYPSHRRDLLKLLPGAARWGTGLEGRQGRPMHQATAQQSRNKGPHRAVP